ncbi:MAG: retropepsin-like aspartic protease [Sphingomonas sp.]
MSLPQAVPPIPVIAAEQPPVPDDMLQFDNRDRRMTVRVSIADRGPYEFVVDTGAERTVVSHDLAGLLGLKAGRRVRVTAMTNAALVGTVVVPTLSVNQIAAHTIEAPALDQDNMGAPGMLGLDALRDHAISIDFDRNEMTVRPSRRARRMTAGPSDIVVTAKSQFGQLIVTDAQCHGHRISVVVDTGTPITVANPAFLAMLGKMPKSLGQISMISALGQAMTADYVEVDRLDVGGVGFNNVPLAIADAEPFRRFGLTKEPALLLGMDALRLFRQVDIDFANRQIRFSLPNSVLVATR